MSPEIPGQYKHSRALLRQALTPRCELWILLTNSSLQGWGTTTLSALKISPCCTDISSLMLKYGEMIAGKALLSSGQPWWITAFRIWRDSSISVARCICRSLASDIGRNFIMLMVSNSDSSCLDEGSYALERVSARNILFPFSYLTSKSYFCRRIIIPCNVFGARWSGLLRIDSRVCGHCGRQFFFETCNRGIFPQRIQLPTSLSQFEHDVIQFPLELCWLHQDHCDCYHTGFQALRWT